MERFSDYKGYIQLVGKYTKKLFASCSAPVKM